MTGSLALARLVIAGDAGARRRLLGIAAGVMLGVAIALMLLAASQAIGIRSERSTWAAPAAVATEALTADTSLTADQAVVVGATDFAFGQAVTVLRIATLPGTTFRVPGSDVVPGAGEYLASPALAQLVASTPSDGLAERYGTLAGTLSPDAIAGPDSLVLVQGATMASIVDGSSGVPASGAAQITTELVGYDYASDSYRVVALVGAVTILVPVLLLIGIVTDLGAAQRAERFATLRLVGATPRRVAGIAATETAATALIGSVLGVALYLALIPLAARIQIDSTSFFRSDLLTSPGTMLAAVVITVAGAASVAWWRTLRADVGPLGASRERAEKPPRALAVAPLLLGLGALAGGRTLSRAGSVGANVIALVVEIGIPLTMLGLLWAGPVLTAWVARAAARGARSAAQVLGLGRLVQHPRSAFRAVGGIVAALYAVTLFSVGITSVAGTSTLHDGPGYLDPTTLVAEVDGGDQAAVEAAVASLSQVTGVRTATAATVVSPPDATGGAAADPAGTVRVLLPVTDAIAHGAAGASSPTGWVSINERWLFGTLADPQPAPEPQPTTQPASTLWRVVLIGTDGDAASVEQARTAIELSGLPLMSTPTTIRDLIPQESQAPENQFAALGYIGILIAVGVSTLSLAVSSVSSVLSRRRVLSLLRLVGMPRRVLRHAITYETVLPVGTVLALSIAAGAFSAWALVTSISEREVGWPPASYYAVLGICVALLGAAAVASTRVGSRLVAKGTVRFE